MVQRRIPRPHDLAPLLTFKRPELNPTTRRLENALTIADLRAIAHRRIPKAAYDYVDGAAEGELSIARARQAYEDIEFHPSILRDVSNVDTSTQIFGGPSALPFAIAPIGFTRMVHSEGERAGAAAAGAAGIPFTLSTMATTGVEAVREANPNGRLWFQLYMWRDRDRSMSFVERAAKAGYDTLHITVDVPTGGARLRDKRNGMTIPPTLTPKTVVNAIPRPQWWFDFLTTEPLRFAAFEGRFAGTMAELTSSMFDPSVTFEDLDWIRTQWPGKVVVKGIQTIEDARRVVDHGVDGIVLSNHGGRQLDRAPIPFHMLPHVARELGRDTEIMVDTGIMSGADIVAAIALGARLTFIGRAYMYGLMAGGRRGADRSIAILRDQIERTMRLLGVASLDELNPGHVTQLARLMPIAAPAAEAAAAAPARRAPARRAPAKATAAKR
jgi:L-lactate dehydrogenase (cytochrome)